MRSCSPLNRHRQILATLPLTAAVSAAITATSLLAPSAAMAQLEEVVVTARARTESLQDVPATVTAFTEGQIENMGIARAEDFVYMTPGVTFVNSVEVGDSQLAIRGINGARDGESAVEKVELLKECGVTISKNPSVMGETVKSVLNGKKI